MRTWCAPVLALFLFPLIAGLGAEPADDEGAPPVFIGLASGPVLTVCDGVAVDPAGDVLVEAGCATGEIRPGAWGHGCTLDFVMTDGIDHYVGTAGHCGAVGKRWSTPGVGDFGTTVFREFDYSSLLDIRDWALIRVDPEDVAQVNPTMYRYGGPFGVAPGVLVARPPVPGEVVLQYGHGAGMGQEDATKGRAGEVIGLLGDTTFLYAGLVGGGDSGSPVRFASGQAAGIAVAYLGTATGDARNFVPSVCSAVDAAAQGNVDSCLGWDTLCAHLDGACAGPLRPGNGGPVVFVTRMDAAVAAFEGFLGRDLDIVEGALPVRAPL